MLRLVACGRRAANDDPARHRVVTRLWFAVDSSEQHLSGDIPNLFEIHVDGAERRTRVPGDLLPVIVSHD